MSYHRIAPFVALVLLLPSMALADAQGEAKKHFQSGKALMKSDDFSGAAVELERSVALFPTKNGLFNLANCYKVLQRYGEALRTFKRLRAEFGSKMDEKLAADVRSHEQQIRALVGEVEVRVEPPGSMVLVDGKEVGQSPLPAPLYLGPGEHVIGASQSGYRKAEEAVVVASASKSAVTLVLEAQPAASTAPAVASVPAKGTDESENPYVSADAEQLPEHSEPPMEDEDQLQLPDNGSTGPEKPARLTPWAWTGAGLTVATGAAAVVCWLLGNGRFSDFEDAGKDFTAGKIHRDDSSITEPEDDAKLYGGLAIGLGVSAGVFAVATAVLFALDSSAQMENLASAAALGSGKVSLGL